MLQESADGLQEPVADMTSWHRPTTAQLPPAGPSCRGAALHLLQWSRHCSTAVLPAPLPAIGALHIDYPLSGCGDHSPLAELYNFRKLFKLGDLQRTTGGRVVFI